MKAVVFIVVGIIVLLAVNYMSMYKSTGSYGPSMEMFQNVAEMPPGMPPGMPVEGETANLSQGMNYKAGIEGFSSYFLSDAAGSKDSYKPMGAYDGVTLPTGNSVSSWRYTAPNEKLLGDEFVPGPDSLFMFKNNQCKPECCGASFSCGGGCVCTTPQQRQLIAGRGGNRTRPEDSA